MTAKEWVDVKHYWHNRLGVPIGKVPPDNVPIMIKPDGSYLCLDRSRVAECKKTGECPWIFGLVEGVDY